MNDPSLFAITRDVVNYIRESDAPGGDLEFGFWEADDLYVVTRIEIENQTWRTIGKYVSRALNFAAAGPRHTGQWLRSQDDWAHVQHRQLVVRPNALISLEAFKANVPYVSNTKGGAYVLLMVRDDLPEDLVAAGCKPVIGWKVTPAGVVPADVEVEPEQIGLGQLAGAWPVAALQQAAVTIVGVGSIGGRVADALAGYGLGHLTLVDPDRHLWHNVVRHVLDARFVGRHKVDAMKEYLNERWPETDVTVVPSSVIAEAATLRSVLPGTDALVCAADGIAARRATSHLAKRANVSAVLTCVLEDGLYGEVLRQRPGPRYSCLMCHRRHLAKSGSIDIEAAQEAGYGDGDPHRPMTAAGPDLWLVAHLAAKVTVATILQAGGDDQHQLPGEHAVVSLRPVLGLKHPFDFSRAADLQWFPVPPPQPGCPTCRT